MEFVLEKSAVISLDIVDSLEGLVATFQKYFVFIAPGFQMGEFLLIPEYDFVLDFFVVEVVAGVSVFLNEKKRTLVAQLA